MSARAEAQGNLVGDLRLRKPHFFLHQVGQIGYDSRKSFGHRWIRILRHGPASTRTGVDRLAGSAAMRWIGHS